MPHNTRLALTSSANSCHTTSYINSRGYDLSIKSLHLLHSSLHHRKDNSHVTSSAQYATKASQLVHTSTPTHNFSPQLQNLIELQILRTYLEHPLTFIISIGSYYTIPTRHTCRLSLLTFSAVVTLAIGDHSSDMSATTLLQHLSNQTF